MVEINEKVFTILIYFPIMWQQYIREFKTKESPGNNFKVEFFK